MRRLAPLTATNMLRLHAAASGGRVQASAHMVRTRVRARPQPPSALNGRSFHSEPEQPRHIRPHRCPTRPCADHAPGVRPTGRGVPTAVITQSLLDTDRGPLWTRALVLRVQMAQDSSRVHVQHAFSSHTRPRAVHTHVARAPRDARWSAPSKSTTSEGKRRSSEVAPCGFSSYRVL